jgi:hypothetical protein
MVSQSQLKQYKEIIDRHIKKSDPLYVDVEKEFKEGFAGLIVARDRDYSAAKMKNDNAEKIEIGGVSLK